MIYSISYLQEAEDFVGEANKQIILCNMNAITRYVDHSARCQRKKY